MGWGLCVISVLLLAVNSAIGTCVFNSEFGFTLNCGFKKSSLFRVRNLGGVKAHVGLGFSVGDELGFPEALSNTDETENQRRSTDDLQSLRSVAMSTGRSSGARSPQLSWNLAPSAAPSLAGTAGAMPGAMVPPFKPLANAKEAVVPPFSALPPSIARIPVLKQPAAPVQPVFQPAAPVQPVFQPVAPVQPVFQPSAPVQPVYQPVPIVQQVYQPQVQQMSNRRYQQESEPLKNSIVIGSVEPLPSPMQEIAAPLLHQQPAIRQTSSNSIQSPSNLASKTKVLQNALHHGTYDGYDLTSPSPLLMGHSLQSLSKASNISVEALAAALRLREQQLLAAKTSTTTSSTTTTTTTTSTTTPRPTRPATVKTKYPMIGPSRVMNAPKEYYPVSYDQNYDDNFTSKVELPDTTFSCGDQKHFPGLYADEDLGCMVFHVCAFTDDGMVMKSFLCPESTLFDQSILKCNWWFYVDCKASKRLYDSNIPISKSYQLMKALAFFSAYKNHDSINT